MKKPNRALRELTTIISTYERKLASEERTIYTEIQEYKLELYKKYYKEELEKWKQ